MRKEENKGSTCSSQPDGNTDNEEDSGGCAGTADTAAVVVGVGVAGVGAVAVGVVIDGRVHVDSCVVLCT